MVAYGRWIYANTVTKLLDQCPVRPVWRIYPANTVETIVFHIRLWRRIRAMINNETVSDSQAGEIPLWRPPLRFACRSVLLVWNECPDFGSNHALPWLRRQIQPLLLRPKGPIAKPRHVHSGNRWSRCVWNSPHAIRGNRFIQPVQLGQPKIYPRPRPLGHHRLILRKTDETRVIYVNHRPRPRPKPFGAADTAALQLLGINASFSPPFSRNIPQNWICVIHDDAMSHWIRAGLCFRLNQKRGRHGSNCHW